MARDTLTTFRKLKQEAQALFEEKGAAHLERVRRSPVHGVAHFCVLVLKSFVRNRCPVRASALAYTTLLALIPLLAIGISVSSSLLKSEGERPIEELIDKLVANVAPALNLEVKKGDLVAASKRQEVVANISAFIANIRSGTLGVTGTVALMFIAIGLLRTIEASFNDIWGVTRGRGWVASITQYWAAITLGPIVLALAFGLTSGPHFTTTARVLEKLPFIGSLILQLLPFAVLSLAFGLFYQLMPNTRVRWQAALVGGIVGGCLWQMNNLFNVIYVSRVVTYNKIYGSLGIIPLFLVGLYFSWLILLLGAQVAYAYQNREAYLQEKQAENVSHRGREFVALRLATHVALLFHRGEKAPTTTQLASALGVPSQLASQILQAMLQAKLIVEVLDRETAFAPARPLEQITALDILNALRIGQGQELATTEDAARASVRAAFEQFSQAEKRVASQVTLQDLVAAAAPANASLDSAGPNQVPAAAPAP